MKIFLHHYHRHRPLIHQFSRFAIVGVINTGVSFGTYILATRPLHIHPLVGNVIAFVVAVTVSFVLNRRYTFRHHHGRAHHQYGKFLAVNLVGLGLSELIIAVLHIAWGVHDFIAFAVAVVLVLFWNFWANRQWTFSSANLPAA